MKTNYYVEISGNTAVWNSMIITHLEAEPNEFGLSPSENHLEVD